MTRNELVEFVFINRKEFYNEDFIRKLTSEIRKVRDAPLKTHDDIEEVYRDIQANFVGIDTLLPIRTREVIYLRRRIKIELLKYFSPFAIERAMKAKYLGYGFDHANILRDQKEWDNALRRNYPDIIHIEKQFENITYKIPGYEENKDVDVHPEGFVQ